MARIFNPSLVFSTFLGREGRTASLFPANKEECIKYAKELAEGLGFWATLDIIVVVSLFLLLWTTDFIVFAPLVGLVVLAFCIGCPLTMTIGYSYGCLQHLTIRELVRVLREHFRQQYKTSG